MSTTILLPVAQSLVSANSSPTFFVGGRCALLIEGTFGGATAQIQFQSPTSAWVDVTSTLSPTMTTPGLYQQELPAGFIRLNLTGGTGANLNAWLLGIEW